MYSPIQYVEKLTFPASKDGLIIQAQNRHAPENVISELDKLPDQTYNSFSELVNTYELYK